FREIISVSAPFGWRCLSKLVTSFAVGIATGCNTCNRVGLSPTGLSHPGTARVRTRKRSGLARNRGGAVTRCFVGASGEVDFRSTAGDACRRAARGDWRRRGQWLPPGTTISADPDDSRHPTGITVERPIQDSPQPVARTCKSRTMADRIALQLQQ